MAGVHPTILKPLEIVPDVDIENGVHRYIFVPLGGSRSSQPGTSSARMWLLQGRNILVVFTFVALWHDMTLKLLTWGWLMAVAFLPESLARWAIGLPRLAWLRSSQYYPHLAALCGAMNVLLLIVGNMVR